ncbi:MAG: hypothetical protein FIB01_05135 [Gemmatimonadetes bacterium]|nr:hypothetical protein [Gemmatimonadota bacterium]
MRTRVVLTVLFCLAAPRFAGAQGVPADSARSVVLRNAIGSNWHVRLASTRDTIDGRVLAVDGDVVRLVGSAAQIPGIERIERLRKQGGGGLAGGLIGGLGLGGLGYLLSGLCEDNCDWVWAKAFVTGAVIGGVPGAIVGNTVAPPRRTWDPIWP